MTHPFMYNIQKDAWFIVELVIKMHSELKFNFYHMPMSTLCARNILCMNKTITVDDINQGPFVSIDPRETPRECREKYTTNQWPYLIWKFEYCNHCIPRDETHSRCQ